MTTDKFQDFFTTAFLREIFPAERSDQFFEALYGDVDEGVYDISLTFEGHSLEQNALLFHFRLTERPGKCLACHLTSGLPEVFARHPIIGVTELVEKIDERLGGLAACETWRLSPTRTISRKIYAVPLTVTLR